MAEAEPPSTKDLLLLITGLHSLKAPPTSATSGETYYLNETHTALRESDLTHGWLLSPKAAWSKVQYRDWLIATFLKNAAGHNQEFVAISEPLILSFDVLSKEFSRDMKGATDAIRELMVNEGKERTLFTTLSLGISKRQHNGKDIFVVGAGMRRRVSTWTTESEALQADVEFFVPFYVIPNGEEDVQQSSICAGIAISRSNGGAILEKEKDIVGVRFNLRIPFKTEERQRIKSDEVELHTIFGDPEIKIEKRTRETSDSRASTWHPFDDGEAFAEAFCESDEGAELLVAPVGPLLLETVPDNSGIKDIILKQSKRAEIKTDLQEFKKELDETLEFLKKINEWKPPEKDPIGPHSSQRRLGSLLASLGFLNEKNEFKLKAGLTPWDVVNGIIDELDGYPLYIKGQTPKTDKEARIAVSLASQRSETDDGKHYFGLAGLLYNIGLKTVSAEEAEKKKEEDPDETSIVVSDDNFTDDESILIEDEDDDESSSEEENKDESKDKKKSTVEVYLHLGKWLSGESLDDNWYKRLLPGEVLAKRRAPLPGIRVLPFRRIQSTQKVGNTEAVFAWTFLLDLLSFGIDIKGTTKNGLGFLDGILGHFGLGAVEVRLALKISAEDVNVKKDFFDRVSIGVAVKLKDLRLSFAPKEDDKKKDSDQIIAGLQELLADDWAVVPAPPKPEDKKPRTRLSAKKKDKFSISVGYLTPLVHSSHGTLDIQLYDEKGNRGKMAFIPIDRQTPFMYLRQIGIGLKGVENVELSKGLPDSAQLTVSITGGIKMPVFELGFIGAKLIFQLNKASNVQFALDGLDVSLKIGSIVISGSFFKSGIEYAGSLTIEFPKASFSAMGFFGSLRVFSMSPESEIVMALYNGNVHDKLRKKLIENKLTPAASRPIKVSNTVGKWELRTTDEKVYTITEDDGKLNILRPEKTFFVYATLNSATGCGPAFGPIVFTGIALGYGYNRRMIIPRIENVAEFPLVQMVMGEGGYQDESKSLDPREQMGKTLADPTAMLEKMKDHVVPEGGQQFACLGVRFTISGVVDCFALAVVQWGNELEISLLGLARFRHTRDLTAAPICYVELQILMSLKPSEGTFKLQALLTSNSWIINTDCKLTGGFALFIWFDGPNKGDLVLTLGGYHPRFRRPAHYPLVPRLGLNWPVNNNLTIKGGVYLAITPSCGMLGAKLEATFHSGRISAWFTAYLDVIINWSPLYFEAELGISLRVEASFFLTSIKATIGASIMMWGPPVGGIAHIDLVVISFAIEFGSPRQQQPELIKTWKQFCHDFLSVSGEDTRPGNTAVKAFPITQPNLAAGRNNLNTLPRDRRAQQQQQDDTAWKVRGDELELSGSTVVPAATLNVGTLKSNLKGLQELKSSGQSMMVTSEIDLDSQGLQPKKSASALGAHPMGKKLGSVLNVTVVRDEGSTTTPVNLSQWTVVEETGSLPAALWDEAKPTLKQSEPSARVIPGCIVGLKRLKPPLGKLGPNAPLGNITWHPLEVAIVKKWHETQSFPSTTHSRSVQPVMVSKQTQQKEIVEALASVGFSLGWKPQAEPRFRDLQADPLAGAGGL
ncbi:MAG TPA: DUF6603 domain-containing protein [Pyrinomonadaceae bacterium]|nr:DUF6603 domain-containing protein [Pyrinomonadaceae bacterium]